jgi:hypothetical protein
MSKYDPLADYLRSLPESEREHTISLGEIEQILGVSLPHSARADRSWWANTQHYTQARRWMSAGWRIIHVNLGRGSVTFVRFKSADETSKVPRGRYRGFLHFLERVPAQQEQIALTFEQVGALAGGTLPAIAFRDRPWWANTKASPQGSSWLASGWRVEKVFLKAQMVTFRRKGSNPLRSIPQYVKGLLDESAHLGRPAPRTLASWIRLCKRLGWYFEATVLYERGGLDIDPLTESERAEVDEDYRVCKRELARCSDMLDAMTKGKSHV